MTAIVGLTHTAMNMLACPTANKTAQALKEAEIRANGETHVKEHGRKGKIYNISGAETKRLDVDLETTKVKCH
jgi:hypothetical protein